MSHSVHPVHPGRASDPLGECHDEISIVMGLDRTWIPEKRRVRPQCPMQSSVGDDVLWHQTWHWKTFRAPVGPCHTERDRPERVQEGR